MTESRCLRVPVHAEVPVTLFWKERTGTVKSWILRSRTGMFNLTLDSQENAYLEELVESDLKETRVDLRRTTNPDLQDELHKREDMLRGLLARLRGEKPPPAGYPS